MGACIDFVVKVGVELLSLGRPGIRSSSARAEAELRQQLNHGARFTDRGVSQILLPVDLGG